MNVLDGQVVLESVDHYGFRPCAIARGSAGALSELDPVELLDQSTHEEVEGYVESLAESNQHCGRRHHLARLVLADGLSGDLGGGASGEVAHPG